MKIPRRSADLRFYVLRTENSAVSSWSTREAAEEALRELLVRFDAPPLLGLMQVGPSGRARVAHELWGWTDYPMLESEKGDHARDPNVSKTQAPWRRAVLRAWDRNKYADIEVEGLGLFNFKAGYVLHKPSWAAGLPFSSVAKERLPRPSEGVPCLG